MLLQINQLAFEQAIADCFRIDVVLHPRLSLEEQIRFSLEFDRKIEQLLNCSIDPQDLMDFMEGIVFDFDAYSFRVQEELTAIGLGN